MESVVGTWSYSAPECRFESENLLAQAGGEAVSARIESKMEPIYQKLGIESSVFVFNEDGTYKLTLKKKTSNGTYVFDEEESISDPVRKPSTNIHIQQQSIQTFS